MDLFGPEPDYDDLWMTCDITSDFGCEVPAMRDIGDCLATESGVEEGVNQGSKVGVGKRGSISKSAREEMSAWLLDHAVNPYPSPSEITAFANKFSISRRQVQVFFTNNRSRLLGRRGVRNWMSDLWKRLADE
jgi:hypothetical protein